MYYLLNQYNITQCHTIHRSNSQYPAHALHSNHKASTMKYSTDITEIVEKPVEKEMY